MDLPLPDSEAARKFMLLEAVKARPSGIEMDGNGVELEEGEIEEEADVSTGGSCKK